MTPLYYGDYDAAVTASPEEHEPPPRALIYLGVVVAIASVSASAIFIRLASEAPPLAIAFWRNAFAVALFLPIALIRRDRFPTGRGRPYAGLAGLFLAAHFAFWITSLQHTTVAASVVLVCTQPIFVAVLAWFFLKERLDLGRAGGIGIAFIGTVVIATGDGLSGGAFYGNLLALGGAVTVALYVLFGRVVRKSGTPITSYAVSVYGVAGVTLVVVALALGVPLVGFTDSTWLWIGMIAIFPQVLGHTLFNWALRYLPAAVLSGLILAEPVVSTLLAWIVFDEVPSAATFAGGAVILGGLAVLVWSDLRAAQRPSRTRAD
jgi:drug/metabolite transporter (DMT)-like permease